MATSRQSGTQTRPLDLPRDRWGQIQWAYQEAGEDRPSRPARRLVRWDTHHKNLLRCLIQQGMLSSLYQRIYDEALENMHPECFIDTSSSQLTVAWQPGVDRGQHASLQHLARCAGVYCRVPTLRWLSCHRNHFLISQLRPSTCLPQLEQLWLKGNVQLTGKITLFDLILFIPVIVRKWNVNV